MLRSLDIKNFTIFSRARFAFGPHINVLHGVNGAGKSHVLKLAYCVQHALSSPPTAAAGESPSSKALTSHVANELIEVFRPDALGRLTTRKQGRALTRVTASFFDGPGPLEFRFSTGSRTEVAVSRVPRAWSKQRPIFLPTRAALTFFPGFAALYREHQLEMDRTWLDLAEHLAAPVSRGVKAARSVALLEPIEDAMGGKIEFDRSGRFYLVDQRGRIEIHLVAEGIRKLAMVARLVANGSLKDKACLLWDEPEANLNPRLLVKVAEMLFALADQGVQVILGTHSLFLLRELEIRAVGRSAQKANPRYFGLQVDGDGLAQVQSGDRIEDSGDIAALDENLAQSQRYLDTSDEGLAMADETSREG
jgi:hypothetical protein